MRRKSERATPKKVEVTPTTRRTRRGRGAKSPTPEEEPVQEEQASQQQSQEEQQEESEDEVIVLPKKRGRKSTRQPSTDVEVTPKKRGRQRRVAQVVETIEEEEVSAVEDTKPEEIVQQETVEIVTIDESSNQNEPNVYHAEGTQGQIHEQQVEKSPEQPTYEAITVDDESNAVSENPSESVPNEEESEDIPQEVQKETLSHVPVEEENSKDSDVVEIQPVQDDFVTEPVVREDQEESREDGEIVEEKTEEPIIAPEIEAPRRQRRKFMTHSSIQATRNEQTQKQESVGEQEPAKDETTTDFSEKQHQLSDDTERVSNKKRSSRSKENDHNNIDVVTNMINKTKSSIKSGGAVEHKNDAGKEHEEPNNEEKENEPSATAAISAAPLPAGQRKRKWITQKSVDNKPAIISISTDSLKDLIPEVVPIPLNDMQMDVSPETGEILEESNHDNENGHQKERKRRVSEKSVDNEKVRKRKVDIDAPEKIQITISKETTNHKEKPPLPPSPPKQTQSNILYITNLVRPFTVLQLKGLLARTGKIIENGFWIDKIKSKCFVKYETEDEAVETRHALHGVRWPASNPKCLNVDFGRDKDMEKAIISTLDDTTRTLATNDVPKESSGGFGWTKADALRVEVEQKGWDKERPVREWDLGKKDDSQKENDERHRREERRDRHERKRSRESDVDRRRRSRSASPGRRKERKTENDPPIRLLDDLFRKTKATPYIYWLPLTSEQIAEREEVRRKRLEEQERHLEEMRKAREERMKEREKVRQERNRSRSRENKERDRNAEKRRRTNSRSRSRTRDRRRYNR